ncbi:MAG: hypothetical protein PHI49_11270 [Halothiobacillaceae bacterium]|nr:hypothetical protein [Halothiobacillaceae bacterium]
MVFSETDAIGHPLSSLSGVVAGVSMFCQTEATSFVPYFQSGLDALSWRQEVRPVVPVRHRLDLLSTMSNKQGYPMGTTHRTTVNQLARVCLLSMRSFTTA